ncbi:MAG: hypothetical protein QXM35_08170, partial [Candidatus Methanomethylicia archaeon]
ALLKTLQPLITGVGLTRPQASAAGIQVVMKPVAWSKKPAYIRNLPYTNISPHKGQIEARINFGSVAKRHKGEKGFKEGLPIVAYHIKREVKGYRAPSALRKEDYPSRARRTFHTMAELEAMIRA